MENNGHETLKRQSKYCVGIGASAGGVEALQELFRNMPVDTGASFIVVQHLSPDSVSMMDQILQKSVKMPVRLAEENMELRPNEIYLNVPGMLLEVEAGRLHLKPVQDRLQRYTPINQMFNSLAAENDIHTIAVILSGSGSDGTIGIGSVKENGGIIIVQKPLEAQYASMPQSALSTGLVDLTEKVSKIGLAIRDYLKNPNIQYIHHEDGIEDEEMGRYFDQVIDAVTRYSDIDFTAYKPNTIFRRIERRIAINKFAGIEEYIDHLLSSEEEKRLLCSDLLIGVTSFFRDEAAFRSLGEQVLSVLLRAKRSVRIWSIACSTGEEAYSIAIMVCEYMERLKCNVDVKIFATDTDPDAIAVAQKGFYNEGNLSDVSDDIIEKYFDKKEGRYVVKDLIRKMIVFAKHNIFRDAPFSKLDLIVCRNMFIYVKTEVQQRAIENFYHLLNEGGYLFLGSSESLGDMDKAFESLDRKWKIYIKIKGYHTENNGFYLWDNLYHPRQSTDSPSASQRSKVQAANIFEKILFAFAGPSVLVDGFGKIVQIIQGGGKYLSLQDGTFDNSISSCFAPSLTILLNHIMEELKEEGSSVIERSVAGVADYPNECLKIKISYFNIEGEDYYLIQIGIGQIIKEEPVGEISLDISELKNSRISQLEKELGESNWKLSLAMEESESRNEELQATNEELMASNEELQSTNEEMQSINEELYTINAEHQSKIVELTTAYTDFDNLLVNAEVGALYVDRDMKIRKITPIMLQNTNLLPTDLGRPVYHINFIDTYEAFISDVKTVSETGAIIEKEVTDANNIIWLVRIRPYHEKPEQVGGLLVTMFDITKRLEAAKFELKQLTDSVPGGVVRMHYDRELVIDYANDSFYALTGYSPAEVKRQFNNHFSRMILREDWEKMERQIEAAADGDGILKEEYRGCVPGLPVRWYSIQAAVFGADGLIELQGIIMDISKIKDYEQQLKKERDNYDTLYQNMLCGIAQYEYGDKTMRFVSMNPEAIRMLGYSSTEEFKNLGGPTMLEITFEEDREEIAGMMLALKKRGDSASFDHRIVRADGVIRWVTGASKLIAAPDGKLLIQSTFIDTTEEKATLKQLKDERDRYDLLYETSYNMAVCGVIQADIESGKVLAVNREAVNLLGADTAELERELFDQQTEDSGKDGLNLSSIGKLMQSVKMEERRRLTGVLKLKDRNMPIEGAVDLIMEDNGARVVQFTFLDSTERELLREAETKLAVATKSNKAKSYFLSKMSHEIRTPLNGIVGMIDSALLCRHDGEKLQDCLNKLKRSSLHLQQLVSDVLDLSKIESGKMELDMEPVDLRLLLSDVIGEFDALAKEKGVGLTHAGKLLHRYVMTDKVKLHKILANLTGNALKFVDSSGIVLLNIEEAAMTAGEAKFTFQVQDNGKGIREEDQERIFEAFDQGSHDKLYGNSGSGLGLTICKNLVEMLGGELKVESIEGAGTEFSFTLTMEILDEDKKQEILPMCDARYKGLRVMVAEDNLINGEIAETLLRSFGFEVDLVLNGKEAVDKFTGSPEETYSIVLMDIQMPVMNGYDAARQIRDCGHADAKTIPILAMSANAFQEDIARSLDSGMNEHLSKPIDMEKLFHSILNYMD
ncbi:ATP-binding protein [Ruminococcus sp. OA3]|uniref:CheR family methyltransferase n=1 Tax=Ruminococcus sp. OA3 TaxID=2914164 RepID=UPI001F05D6CA|nr:CheR family methyltransferase [Ruminococcus sp. OA3]MCH1983009.1 ATP-binding protein [Ruminococcus sp. OA3]